MTASQTGPVPLPDSGEATLIWFAHTYDGYRRHGGFEDLAALAHAVRTAWNETRGLPADLDALRGCLFFEVRAHRHAGGWEPFDDRYVRELVGAIAAASGGIVDISDAIESPLSESEA